ncbi:MAG: Lrp/AsnC family transcriptional regulator [Anaerolineae bacterium]|nr:Lrp/AsnC family transcriptional regulator [Anaerolineae bacterium]
MDEIDFKAIEMLTAQARITWAELAIALGLSAPATAERVRRLEADGVIKQYTAILGAEELGLNLTAFIAVTLDRPQHRQAFLVQVAQTSEIQECHHVAGDDDYLLKVRCQNTKHLDWLLTERIKGITGVTRTRTTIVLSTAKETAALPLPAHIDYEE